MPSFTCPDCGKVLRTSAQPGPGKKIRCPGCGETFVPEAQDEKRPLVKKKASGGSMLYVILGLVGVAGFCAVGICGVAGWFLFNRPPDSKNVAQDGGNKALPAKKNPGELNNNNVEDFVHPRSTILVGINTKSLRDSNQLDAILKQFEGQPGRTPIPAEQRDLLQNSERILISGIPAGASSKPLVGIVATNPDALARFRKSPDLGPEEKVGPYRVHRPGGQANLPPVVLFPGDRLVLMGELEDNEVTELLDRVVNQQVVPAPAAPLARSVEGSPLWVAWTFDEQARTLIRSAPQDLAKGAPDILAAAEALQKARGGTLSADQGKGGLWNLRVNVECSSPADAKTVKDGADSLRGLALTLLAFSGKGTPALMKDLNTIALKNEGSATTLDMQLSMDTLTQLMQAQTVPTKRIDEPKFDRVPKFTPIVNLKSGASHEYTLTVQQGKFLGVRVGSLSTQGATKAKIEILAGDRVVGEIANEPPRAPVGLRVSAPAAPMTESYRIRVTNMGPGHIKSMVLTATLQ